MVMVMLGVDEQMVPRLGCLKLFGREEWRRCICKAQRIFLTLKPAGGCWFIWPRKGVKKEGKKVGKIHPSIPSKYLFPKYLDILL